MTISNYFRWNGVLGTEWFATDETPRSNWDWLNNPGTNPGIPVGAGDAAVIDKGGDVEIGTTSVAGAEEMQIANATNLTWAQGDLGIGSDGSGGLIIDEGSELSIASGASLTNSGSLDVIGLTGGGSLDVTSGAAFDDVGMIVGVDEGASGEVTIGNAFFAVAQSGSGGPGDGVLVVGDGGDGSVQVDGANYFYSAFAIVGKQAGATGTIDVNGAIWAGSSLTIGQSGTGHVTIGANSIGAIGDIVVGAEQGSSGDLTMNGASWDGDSLEVGQSGTGDVSIGEGSSARFASVLIDPNGSIGVTGSAAVGSTLNAAVLTIDSSTLDVADGGVLQSGTAVVDAGQDGAGAVNVTGGTWSGGDLTIGQSGSGEVSIGASASLSVDNILLGAGLDASGSLDVDSSNWTGKSLTVGQAGTGSVTISPGSSANIDAVLIGPDGSLGVTGLAGSAGSLIATTLTIDFGTLDVSQGGEVLMGAAAGTGGAVSIEGAAVLVGLGSLEGDVVLMNGGQVQATAAVPGALKIDGSISGAGSIEPLMTLEVNGVVDAAVDIAFSPSIAAQVGDLVLDVAGGEKGTITGFGVGNTIDIRGSDYASAVFTQGTSGSAGTLTLSGGESAPLALAIVGDYAAGAFAVTQLAVSGAAVRPAPASGGFGPSGFAVAGSIDTVVTLVACFAAGTHIAIPDGEIAVEALREGDMVRLHDGGIAPVRWIGHRRIDCSRHPVPRQVWPVRVTVDTFGPGLPWRDLFLSPDHAVFAAGVLIPVKYLVNGSSITQEVVAEAHYFHVELSAHDLLLAEGLPVESYLDTGDRATFSGGKVMLLHPEFAARAWQMRGCAELVSSGARLNAVRASLATGLRAAMPRHSIPAH